MAIRYPSYLHLYVDLSRPNLDGEHFVFWGRAGWVSNHQETLSLGRVVLEVILPEGVTPTL